MRVHIFEQFVGGHHTNYLEQLLRGLAPMKGAAKIDKLIVSITKRHRESLQFRQQLARFEDEVSFDASVPDVDPSLPYRERIRVAKNFRTAVLKHPANLTISTTADQETLVAAFLSLAGIRLVPPSMPIIGITHVGYAGGTASLRDTVKEYIYHLQFRYAPWAKIGIVNPLVYEWATHRIASHSDRLVMIPDPVPRIQTSTPSAARRRLGIPEQGTYIGQVGTTDRRKAIPELLAAFKAVARPGERLLLAGSLSHEHRALAHREYADQLQSGALVLVDRYLEPEEIAHALSALDVVAILHYPRAELSANFLKAVAAGRPVIADRFGYTGAMIERLKLGHSCDVLNSEELAATVRSAIDAAPGYRFGEGAKRLMEFHHPDNFLATVLASAIPDHAITFELKTKSWQWVMDGR